MQESVIILMDRLCLCVYSSLRNASMPISAPANRNHKLTVSRFIGVIVLSLFPRVHSSLLSLSLPMTKKGELCMYVYMDMCRGSSLNNPPAKTQKLNQGNRSIKAKIIVDQHGCRVPVGQGHFSGSADNPRTCLRRPETGRCDGCLRPLG